MKHFNKNFIVITIFLSVFLLSGCTKNGLTTKDASKDKTLKKISGDTTNIPNQSGNNKSKVMPGKIKDNPTPSSVQPVANRELTIYSINVETGDTEPVTALIPKNDKLTPKLIVDTVVEALEDQSIIIGIDDNGVSTKGDAIIVSFLKDQAPYKNVGASYEDAILNSIAQSLLDNLDDYKKVIYRIEGNAYKSGHIELGINEVYLGDN